MTGEAPFLLVTDLDNTLIGSKSDLALFNDTWRRCAPKGSKLIYNTGRSLDSFKQHICDGVIVPDAFIAGVGTRVR